MLPALTFAARVKYIRGRQTGPTKVDWKHGAKAPQGLCDLHSHSPPPLGTHYIELAR
jgi:hypothetical protein